MASDSGGKEGKGFQAIRFREGDLITIGEWTLECSTYDGHRELKIPKAAKAKVQRKLDSEEPNG